MKYWIIITNEKNWNIIKKKNIYAVKKENELKRLNKGDFLVVYVTPSQFAGLYKIKKLSSSRKVKFSKGEYTGYLDIDPIIILEETIKVNNKSKDDITRNVSVFRNPLSPERWGAVLMGKSILEITKEDYMFIKSKITSK